MIPLPNEDFEPTEVAAPWRVLRDGGVEVVFATPDGKTGACDPLALEGVVFKQIGATPADAVIYGEMQADAAFRNPIPYDAIEAVVPRKPCRSGTGSLYRPDLLMHFIIYEAAESEDAAKRRNDHEISQLRDVRG